EEPIELHARDRQLLEGGEGGVADAEVIERDRDAERAQLAERIDGGRAGLKNRLGDLELERAGGESRGFERARHVVDEVALEELRRGDVDRHGGLRPAIGTPAGGGRDRGVQRSEEHTSELQSRENLVC